MWSNKLAKPAGRLAWTCSAKALPQASGGLLPSGLASAGGQPANRSPLGQPLRHTRGEKRPARPQQHNSQKHKQIMEATRSYSTREAQGKQAQGANKKHKENKHKGSTRAKQEAQGKHKENKHKGSTRVAHKATTTRRRKHEE